MTERHTMSLADELSATCQGKDDPRETARAVIERRPNDATIIDALTEPDKYARKLINDVLLGVVYDRGTLSERLGGKPLRKGYQLQSLLKHCPRCDSGGCKRKGKYHDIVYKTDVKERGGRQLKAMSRDGAELDEMVLCKVDPETGMFLEQLDPNEAKKCLRQWGEYGGPKSQRYLNREARTGDKWVVRDCLYHANRQAPAEEPSVPRTRVA